MGPNWDVTRCLVNPRLTRSQPGELFLVGSIAEAGEPGSRGAENGLELGSHSANVGDVGKKPAPLAERDRERIMADRAPLQAETQLLGCRRRGEGPEQPVEHDQHRAVVLVEAALRCRNDARGGAPAC